MAPRLFEMAGVAGTGARIRLDYLDPGGARTSGLLPSGRVADTLDAPGLGSVEASLVDATNPVAFVRATDVGRTALESPELLESDSAFMETLDALRRAAGASMGMAATPAQVPLSNPKIALVAPPSDYRTLSGECVDARDYDIAIRIVSMERMHRAVRAVPEQAVVGPGRAGEHGPVEAEAHQAELAAMGVPGERQVHVPLGHMLEAERIVEQEQP